RFVRCRCTCRVAVRPSALGQRMDLRLEQVHPHAHLQGVDPMQRRNFLKMTAAMAGAATLPVSIEAFGAKDPIKVGVLHSLSGTLAVSETALQNTALISFEQTNAAGGVAGGPTEPVVVDPASNRPLFAEKA